MPLCRWAALANRWSGTLHSVHKAGDGGEMRHNGASRRELHYQGFPANDPCRVSATRAKCGPSKRHDGVWVAEDIQKRPSYRVRPAEAVFAVRGGLTTFKLAKEA
jgi:hypothetical protein